MRKVLLQSLKMLGLAVIFSQSAMAANGSFYGNQGTGSTKYSFATTTATITDGSCAVGIDFNFPNSGTNTIALGNWAMVYMHAPNPNGSASSCTNKLDGVFGEIQPTGTTGDVAVRITQGKTTGGLNTSLVSTTTSGQTIWTGNAWHNLTLICDGSGNYSIWLDGVQYGAAVQANTSGAAAYALPTGASAGTSCGFGMKYTFNASFPASTEAVRLDNFRLNGTLLDNFDSSSTGDILSTTYNPSWLTNSSVNTSNNHAWTKVVDQSTGPVPVTVNTFSAE